MIWYCLHNKLASSVEINPKLISCKISKILRKVNIYKKYRITSLKEKITDADEKIESEPNLHIDKILNNSNRDNDAMSFFKEISEEVRMIEWPTLDRLFKQFVIVVISLVSSALFIYSIDGLFAWGTKSLFENKL